MKTTENITTEPNLNDVLVVLGAYLSHAADDGKFYGGYSGEQALEALQNLLGWNNEKMADFVEIFRQ